MQGKKRLLSIVGMSALLSACSLMSPVKSEPPANYMLSHTPTVAVKKNPRPISLLVSYPQSSAVYNTTQMAYSTQPFKVAYFAKSQWADTPSQMMQPLITKTLQNTNYFRQVITPGMLGQYDYVLNTQLLQMEQVFLTYSCEMRIDIKAQLVSVATGRVIASKEFSVNEPAAPTPYGGVVAANKAVAKILANLAQFTVRSV